MATAGVKISNLRELVTAEDTDYIVINDASQSTTKKITRANFLKDAAGIGGKLFIDEAAGIVSNDNDITIPTSAAVKDYVDGVVSDYRSKIIQGETQNALSLVNQLKVYQTKYTEDMLSYEEGVFDSLIAHELQEVVPYAVMGEKDALMNNGSPSYQKVSYNKLVPILISAIQDLSKQVDDLKTQIEILRG